MTVSKEARTHERTHDESDYLRYRGKCKEMAEAACASDPSLSLMTSDFERDKMTPSKEARTKYTPGPLELEPCWRPSRSLSRKQASSHDVQGCRTGTQDTSRAVGSWTSSDGTTRRT